MAAAEEGERARLAEEQARSGTRAAHAAVLRGQRECAAAEGAARAAVEAAAERSLQEIAEGWARAGVCSAEAGGWRKVLEGAVLGAADASGSCRGRSGSSGRAAEGATPEQSSAGDPGFAAGSYEGLVTLGKKLGQGSFGVVFAADPVEGGAVEIPANVAIKAFLTPEVDEDRMQCALGELSSLPPHPHLVSMYCHGMLPEDQFQQLFHGHSTAALPADGRLHYHWMVVSKAAVNLAFYIHRKTHKKERIKVGQLAAWVGQAATGLAELHRNGLVHTDMKVCNLLLAPKGDDIVVQLGDIDSVHKVGAICRMFTPRFLDPFMYHDEHRTASFDWDVWSLGITAHAILTQGSNPSGLVEAFEAAERGEFFQVRAQRGLPAAIGSVLEKCWQPAGERCSAEAFAAACVPRTWRKALPSGSPEHDEFVAVMYHQDHALQEWLKQREAGG